MSQLEPMSRYAMRRLKAETEEKVRMTRVNEIVKDIQRMMKDFHADNFVERPKSNQ